MYKVISKYRRPFVTIALVILIIMISAYFRLTKLGYSEVIADEVDVLLFIFNKGSFTDFLLQQKKGPGQFVVAYLTHSFVDGIQNVEFVERLPFALAGVAFVILQFFLVKKVYGSGTALISILFTSLSGLLIGMSRYIQFPAFIMVFSVLSMLAIISSLSNKNHSSLLSLIAGILSGIGFLFHYDAALFILPITAFLLATRRYKQTAIYFLGTAVVSSIFYIPFMLNLGFSDRFWALFGGRVASKSNSSLFISLNVLLLYHSKEFLVVSFCFFLIWLDFFMKKLRAWKSLLLALAIGTLVLRFFSSSEFIYVTTIVTWSLFIISYLIDIYRKRFTDYQGAIFECWFLFSFFLYLVIVKYPLTHIYNILIPFFIVISNELYKWLKSYPVFIGSLLSILIISSISFNYMAFIDTKVEYPWKKKQYIFGDMRPTLPNKDRGIFGFPYNRRWKDIRETLIKLKESRNIRFYSTNERPTASKFYLKYDLNGFGYNPSRPDVYVQIKNPYSMIEGISNKKTPFDETDTYKIFILNNEGPD